MQLMLLGDIKFCKEEWEYVVKRWQNTAFAYLVSELTKHLTSKFRSDAGLDA